MDTWNESTRSLQSDRSKENLPVFDAPMMRWSLIIALALGTGLVFPGIAWADAEDSVLPAEGKRARILRRIKRAEQEGFERHNLKHYLSLFSKKAIWQFARTSESDPHEYSHSYDEHRRVKALRWQRKPGSKQIHFRWVKWKVVDTQPVIETEVSMLFPGGEKVRQRRYTLGKKRGKWRVVKLRDWPITEKIGPEFRIFNDEAWAELDAVAKRASIDEAMDFTTRMRHLISAHWIVRAYEIAKDTVEEKPGNAAAWRSMAEVGFSLGKVKKARKDAAQAFKLDETIPLSAFLLSR